MELQTLHLFPETWIILQWQIRFKNSQTVNLHW